MIFAAGKFNPGQLIDNFVQMARDDNEKHEENAAVKFTHGDGWGLAYLKGKDLKIYRSTKAVYQDPQLEQFKTLQTRLLLLHARKGSRGVLKLENIHPFELKKNDQQWIFFHNGTVRDELKIDPEIQLRGETDSEKFFYYLLSGRNAKITSSQLREKLQKLTNFSGANFILSNGAITFLCNWYTLNPLYYTMKILQQKESVLVSSEILPHYRQAAWRYLDNQSLFSVRTDDVSIES